MPAKRALIVDDSRSARVILGRMLEGYGLEVDSAESAEQALEYLRQSRPDVIFMDHLMPGMDGFQAIQAIKGNPDTAMIPVMMYTSQEGELYVSQARALGAVGVLPKTVKQVDVSRVLYQLHLLPERRDERTPLFDEKQQQTGGTGTHRIQIDMPPASSVGEIETAVRTAVAPILKEHASEIRRFTLASLEAFARRISTDTRPPTPAAPMDPPGGVPARAGTQEELPPDEATLPPPNRWPLVAAGVAALALVPTIVLAVLYANTLDLQRELNASRTQLASLVVEQQSQIATLQQSLDARNAATSTPNILAAATPVTAAKVTAEIVPYGEAPLAGSRLDHLRELLSNLKSDGFRGKVKVAAYVGEFCLTGNGLQGYSIAQEDIPAKSCDLFGNPFDDSLSSAQKQSLAFANLVSTVRQETHNKLTIEVAYGGRQPSVPYPQRDNSERLTAGDWNKVAMQNNRVEFLAEPTT
jgi:CheY-like chemotaxis protein